MKLTRSHLIMGVMALIIAVLSCALVFYARDEFQLFSKRKTEAIRTAPAVSNKEGFPTITLSQESQAASGIGVSELTAANSQGSAQVYGSVINPQPLFDARAQYLAALAEVRAQRIGITNSENEFQRLKRLNADDRNVSERAVLEAQTRWRADQAKLAAAEQVASTLRSSLRAAWGDAMATWATDPDSKVFRDLSAQRHVLVQVTIPYDMREQIAKTVLTVGPAGVSIGLRPARFVGPAQAAAGASAGATYLYLVESKDLRQGMRVAGNLELDGDEVEGVVIPNSAVVWHGGKAWCYIQEDPKEFVRHEVNTREEVVGGFFNRAGFEPGDKVVTRGAQLLLSEEQKFQIREENED